MPTSEELIAQIRLRFFRDLIESERVKVYNVFGVLPPDHDVARNHGVEAKLFRALLARLRHADAGEAVAWQRFANLIERKWIQIDPAEKDEWERLGYPIRALYTHPVPPAVVAETGGLLQADLAEARAERDRLIANPGAERYWEGRWRDADVELAAAHEQIDEARVLLESIAPLSDDNSPIRKWLSRAILADTGGQKP